MKANSIVRVSLFVLALAVAAPAAMACTSAPPEPPPTWVSFDEDDPTQVWIIFHNYTTFGAQGGQFCVCALGDFDPVTSIDAVSFYEPGTETPIPGFDGFAPNFNTSNDPLLSEFPGEWAGFLSSVSSLIPPDLAVDIHFEVTVPPGTTFEELRDGMRGQGGVSKGFYGTFLATDEGNPDGSFSGHHLQVWEPGLIELGPVPNVQESWGTLKSRF